MPRSSPVGRISEPASIDLESLLARASTGDQDAFAAIYDATAPRLYGVASRLSASPAEAEDLASSAYLDIWRAAAHFDAQRCSALLWMVAAVHRRASGADGGRGPAWHGG
ncbi:sigma factor [Nocardioides sp. SYSU DS0663]|uniref:sigma factor n=1 Tax=Nocardioides sp. SYSU DS0663 TaxID=3416445 RepID=UPI003F4B777E